MTRYKIILFLLLGVVIYSQTPSKALTPNLRLKLYNQGARNIADSINWNWQTIDSWVSDSTARLSANNLWTGNQTFFGNNVYNGTNTFGSTTIINGDITSTGTNSWIGANDFTGALTADEISLDNFVDVTATINSYRVGGNTVLGLTTLGSTVVNSSLTSVGALDSGSITSGFGNINIGLSNFTSDGLVGTSDFISRMTGWRVDGGGNADFRNIYADELHVEAFTADIAQALAGSDFLTKSVAILSRDMTVPAILGTTYLYVEDLPGFPNTQVFQANDWIRLRVVDRSGGGLIVADVWGTVSNYFDLSNDEQRWLFTCRDDGGYNGKSIYTGSLVLDYGTSGDGFIERTVLDAAGSPYTRVATWTTDPSISSNYSLKMQYGSLDGITDPDFGALSGFGYYAVDNIYIKGVIKALAGGEIGGYDIYDTKLETTNAILQGGTAPYFKIWKDASTDYVDMHYNNTSDWGLIGKVSNAILFQLGSANKIAGWNFNASQFSSTNLSGGGDGTYTTSGIALNSSGWLSAPNFALGTTSSKIAGWNFDSEKLYKVSDVNANNKFALNLSATPIIGASQTGFEVYDIDNPKIFVGTKDASGLPSRGFDYNITSSGDFTVRGNFSTRSDIGNDDGIYITDWHIYNRQLSGGIDLESYVNPYQINFAVDGIEKLRLGDINGLQVYGIKTNGDLTLNVPGGVLPYMPYTTSLGAPNRKYVALYASELRVENLVAEETMATIGGRIVIAPTNTLIQSFPDWLKLPEYQPNEITIDVKNDDFGIGDILRMESNGKLEFLRVSSSPTTISGGYRYMVERNLDGTGENTWYEGTALVNTGVAGNGFIDMYSRRSMKSDTQYGPTIVGNIRNSSTWNDWSEVWAIGNLSNLYNQPGGTVGVGLGKYASGSNHIVITPSTGINFFDYNTNIAQWSGSTIRLGQTGIGNQNLIITPSEISFYDNATQVAQWSGSTVTLGEVGAGKSNLLISSGALKLRNNTTDLITLNADGTGTFAGNITSTATITGGSLVSNSVKSSATMTYARGIAGTEAGYFLGYETGNKFFIGSSVNEYFGYDEAGLNLVGGTITGGTIQTATSGHRVVINESGNNSIKLYGPTDESFSLLGGDGFGEISSPNTLNLYATNTMHFTVGSGGTISFDAPYLKIDNGSLLFGFLGDVNLYRSGADVLRTNDRFDALSYRISSTEVIDASRNASFVNLTNSGKTVNTASTVTSGTTIDVSGKTYIELNYSASATITNFTGGTTGQRIVLVKVGGAGGAGGAPITIQDGTNMMLEGSANRVLATDDSMVLIYTSNGYWVEEGTDN